jgi:hypothetical protein
MATTAKATKATKATKRFSRLSLADADRTAWIFGAGASVPYDVPVQAYLLDHFMRIRKGPRFERNLDQLRRAVGAHCRRVLPGLAMDDAQLSLEEVFAAYELARSDRRSTEPERRFADAALRDLRDAVRYATFVFGPGNAHKFRPHDRAGTPSPYAELLEHTYPSDGTAARAVGRHAFVTFNYDINLDRCMINLREAAGVDVDLDYGVTLSNARCPGAPTFDVPRPERSALLLRMHGGLNWVRCWACHSIFTTVNKHADVREGKHCWACRRERIEHVIVHPSYLRAYDDPIIQLVWGRCQEELLRSDRWVLIGYSLPSADVHFRELLRDCLRQRGARRTEIVMVGRRDKNFETTVQTYEWLFERSLRVWDATRGGFVDFVRAIAR